MSKISHDHTIWLLYIRPSNMLSNMNETILKRVSLYFLVLSITSTSLAYEDLQKIIRLCTCVSVRWGLGGGDVGGGNRSSFYSKYQTHKTFMILPLVRWTLRTQTFIVISSKN